MAIHEDHWNKILDKAEVDDVLLQGSGEILQRVWTELTPVLNKLRNNSINKTDEGWKRAFKVWKNSVKKKASSAGAANNELEKHEARYVSLCQKVGIPVGIKKKAPATRGSSISVVEPVAASEVLTSRKNKKRKHDAESDTNISSDATLAQYDMFLNYTKAHPHILQEDTEVNDERWKCLASLLEFVPGKKNNKMVKRDYVGWKSHFQQWIRKVMTMEEEELSPREKEIRIIWNGVLTRRFDAEIDRYGSISIWTRRWRSSKHLTMHYRKRRIRTKWAF